jgi:Lrp/AsnC ligand binding domain
MRTAIAIIETPHTRDVIRSGSRSARSMECAANPAPGGPADPPELRGGRSRHPNVLLAQRLFGDPDYLLRIVTDDLTTYQQLDDDAQSALPGVSG